MYPSAGSPEGRSVSWLSIPDGISRHEFILRFTLSHPGLSSTIVGTSSPEHLRSNVAIASRGALPDDVYAEAKRRLAGVEAGGDR